MIRAGHISKGLSKMDNPSLIKEPGVIPHSLTLRLNPTLSDLLPPRYGDHSSAFRWLRGNLFVGVAQLRDSARRHFT
jgi:hypothetical protein